MVSREKIKAIVAEQGVRFIRLQFTDIFGHMKNISIPVSQLDKALAGDLMFDGSSIDGFVRIEESDMYLKPDLETWAIMPHNKETARLICDVYDADNQPFVGDPRYILRRALAEAAKMGYTMNVGLEAEFFLFNRDAAGNPTLETQDQAAYFDLAPVDLGETTRREIILDLEAMGFEVEASHHECAPGQHEIDFKYADALRSADNLQTFKLVVRQAAQRHNLHATFMPKPISGIAGSGMHVNQSLLQNGKNALEDPNNDLGLSETAFYYLGGLLKHAPAITAITNPTVNSYKRLVSGYEAPVYIAWANKNRSPLVRIPSKRGPATRLELRSPDPSCNPYLALAVMLMAGLDGIKNQIVPPESIERNIYNLDDQERQNLQVKMLPGSLKEALDELKQNQLIQTVLGEHVMKRFYQAKMLEWEEYRITVSQWEVEQYLSKF